MSDEPYRIHSVSRGARAERVPMTSRRLILNWRHEPSGAIMPVAELLSARPPEEPRFEFGYIEGVRRALAVGFQPFLAFPHLHRRYTGSQLFPFFRNRVLPTTHPAHHRVLVRVEAAWPTGFVPFGDPVFRAYQGDASALPMVG